MANEQKTRSCKRVRILSDVRAVVEPPGYLMRYIHAPTNEELMKRTAEELEKWAEEFNAFLRDHRHRDDNPVSIERVFMDQCSECKCEWETDVDEGVTFCAGCGAPVSE